MNTDVENFKNTFLPMGRQMFAEAIRILGNAADAEDAVQEIGRASCRERVLRVV